MSPSAGGREWESDGVSPCWTLPGATRRSLVKFGVASVRMIAEVETHVAEGEHIITSLGSKHQATNRPESPVWLVQSSLYFVEEKKQGCCAPHAYFTFSVTYHVGVRGAHMHPPSFSRTYKSRHRVVNIPGRRRRTILMSRV